MAFRFTAYFLPHHALVFQYKIYIALKIFGRVVRNLISLNFVILFFLIYIFLHFQLEKIKRIRETRSQDGVNH